jgi:hypothetical protein
MLVKFINNQETPIEISFSKWEQLNPQEADANEQNEEDLNSLAFTVELE